MKPIESPPGSHGELRFWHGLEGIGLSIAGIFLISLLWSFSEPPGKDGNVPSWPMMLFQIVIIGIVFVASVIIVLRRIGLSLRDGIKWGPPDGRIVVLSAAGVFPAGILCDELIFMLHRWKPQVYATEFMDSMAHRVEMAPLGGFIFLCVAISLFPAVGEELLFRGLVLKSFRRDMSSFFAIIYSAILFGLVHMDWLQGTAAVVLGLYLAFVTVAGGSLIPAIVAHALNNLLWCLLVRFHSDTVHGIYETGHSPLTLGISVLALNGIIWGIQARSRRN